MTTTIDADQARLFSGMAADWWDRSGSSALLHKVNPVRLGYIAERAAPHFGRDAHERGWLAGLDILDVGCGGGILSECLARLGGRVTAIDAAKEAVEVARNHAAGQKLDIDYRLSSVEILAREPERFDLVTCMEVVEHVLDVPLFLRGLRSLLRPGGMLVFSTPNRTAMSYGVMILGAEWVLRLLPRGTHDWERFLTPDELAAAMRRADLVVEDVQGIAFSPARGFELSRDKRVNYIGAAVPQETEHD